MATDPQPSSEAPETSPEAPAPDSPSPESPPEESPASPEEAPEAPAEEPEGEEPAPEEEEPKPESAADPGKAPDATHKRAGGFQRKIERLERSNQILLEQLAGRMGQPPVPSAPPATKTPEEEAMAQFEKLVDERLAARDAQRAHAARNAEFQKRIEAQRAAKPDFEEVVDSVAHIPVSDALRHTLLTSESGPEIMYQLAKNPAELARISALPPLDAAREVGRLEAKASGAAPQKPKSAARPPAPPSKVGGSASSTRSLDDLPISEYKRAIRSGRR